MDGYKPTYRAKLDTLPWWVASQYLTTKRITDSIENAYFLVSNREYIIEYIANSLLIVTIYCFYLKLLLVNFQSCCISYINCNYTSIRNEAS